MTLFLYAWFVYNTAYQLRKVARAWGQLVFYTCSVLSVHYMHCVCEMLDLQVLHLSFHKHSQPFGLLCGKVVPSHSLQGSALPKQYYSCQYAQM